jgi:hypothetical protein
MQPVEPGPVKEPALKFNKSALFKIVGSDKKIYGPVSGEDIEQWLADERVKLTSLAQKVGHKEWKQLASFAENLGSTARPLSPPVLPGLHLRQSQP